METDGTVDLLTKIDTNLSESLTNQLSEIRELTRQLINMAEAWNDNEPLLLRSVDTLLCDVGLTLDVCKLMLIRTLDADKS